MREGDQVPVNNFMNIYPRFRIGGLASGLDTDKIVSDLMRVERLPLYRLQQQRQLIEWKRDAYREITNLLRGFKDEYFNLLKPSTNMMSQSNYKIYAAESTNSSYVTATGNIDAAEGTHTISIVNLATADKAVSANGVTKQLQGTELDDADVSSLNGKKFVISLDGVTREITIGNYNTVDELADGLESAISAEFGPGKIVVSNVDGKITFSATGGANKITLYNSSSDNGLEDLGFSNGDSNRLDITKTLASQADKFSIPLTFGADGKLEFTINDKPFEFDMSTTISTMINTINSDSTAKVTINYDEVTDRFIITAKQLGAGNNIKISQTKGNFFDGASGISTVDTVTEEGVDATVIIDNVEIKRSSNTFTINGITYNLHKAHSDPDSQSETISVKLDVDKIYEKIVIFVDKYNEIIARINGKLSEEYDSNYLPLTDEQREAMSEDDIKRWEEKAKTGLLRNDSILSSIVYNMRKALYDRIDGLSLGLSNVGITTGKYYEKGKLIIDETKLKEAIRNDPDGVMNVFCQSSESFPNYSRELTPEERNTRYNEQGIIHRLYDVIEDNITSLRDKNGNKGILLQKAGIAGDASEFDNYFYRQLVDYDRRIDDLYDKLYKKEDSYYQKFAAMERALAQMNSQSNWLMMQLNGRSGINY